MKRTECICIFMERHLSRVNGRRIQTGVVGCNKQNNTRKTNTPLAMYLYIANCFSNACECCCKTEWWIPYTLLLLHFIMKFLFYICAKLECREYSPRFTFCVGVPSELYKCIFLFARPKTLSPHKYNSFR